MTTLKINEMIISVRDNWGAITCMDNKKIPESSKGTLGLLRIISWHITTISDHLTELMESINEDQSKI